MSILQNFKDTDHTFEKKFFGAILCIALCVAIFFLIDKTFDKIPEVKRLFIDNGKFFRWFLFASIGVLIFTYTTYIGTLDFWEAETKATIKVSVISVVLWTIIWILWSIFCAWLTLTFNPLTQLVKLTIILLVIIPGLTGFLFSNNIRRQQLKQEEKDKKTMGADYFNSEPYTICIDRKYYSGYYGLLCLPLYLVSLLVGQVF
jgi:magnesium-transporting ATPase (P-type)